MQFCSILNFSPLLFFKYAMRLTVTSVMILLLCGCGFQLAGSSLNSAVSDWPDDERLKVIAADDAAAVRQSIENMLPKQQAHSAAVRDWTLNILRLEQHTEVLLTDRFGRDLEYLFTLSAVFRIIDPDGQSTREASYSVNRRILRPLQSLSDTSQLEHLYRREMERQIAVELFRRVVTHRSGNI